MTAQTDTAPAWMTPGTKVIVDQGRTSGSMYRGTITKVTKAQIIIDDGVRFSRRDLYKIGHSTWDTTKILNPDDPSSEIAWLEYQQKKLRGNLQYDIERLLKEFGRTGAVTFAEQARDRIAEVSSRYNARAAKIAQLTAAAKQG